MEVELAPNSFTGYGILHCWNTAHGDYQLQQLIRFHKADGGFQCTIVANFQMNGRELLKMFDFPTKEQEGPFSADAVIIVGTTGVSIGSLTFTQGKEGDPVVITGEIHGLVMNSKHGFHVHSYGDLRQGCNSAGTHFNPFNRAHGGPTDSIRHVGDLGNVETDSAGVAKVNIIDHEISLVPGSVTSIIGRTIVVHSGEDDLGKGGTPDSLTTGNAGLKFGCGIIGIAAPT